MGTELYTFKARATGIPKKDIIGKADPYLVLRTPMYVSGDSRIKDKTDGRKRVFNATTTAASIAAGVSVTTAAVFASSLAMALAPVVAGAAVVFAIKYASKLHPAKEGYHEIFVSERKKNTFTPDWCPFQLGISEPFKDSEILFECWDWDRAKPSDYVGSVSIPVYELLNSPYERPYQLLDRKGRPAGTLFISCNRSEATPHVVTPHDDEQLNYIPANAYASTNYAAAPCRADSGYGTCGYDASATPAWGLDSSTQSLSSSGYGSEWTSGYDSLNSSRSLASSGYGNDWTGGYDSLNSSQSSGYGNYDPNAQYATSSGYAQYDASAQYDANGQYGASSGYGSSYDASQSPNLWGSSGYDPTASPAWGNAYAGCKDVGYAPSPPMYGGYAAQ